MNMIKKLLAVVALSFAYALSAGVAHGYTLDRAPDRLTDMASLQNGAKLFVNYCLSCHSAVSMRYNKLTESGLTEEEISRNLLFTTDRVGDLMEIAMTPEDGAAWFGAAPPDLSVMARARSTTMGPSGVDYIYSFLRTFYRDASRPTGWDNLVYPSVGMPHVMWERQGGNTLDRVTVKLEAQDDGSEQSVRTTTHIDALGFSEVTTETLENYSGGPVDNVKLPPVNTSASAAYDSDVSDLANFMGWMAEPVQLKRKQIGIWVIFFLAIFMVIAWRLNAAYWKHVK